MTGDAFLIFLTGGARNHLDGVKYLGPHSFRHAFARHMRRTRPHLRDGIMLQGGWANRRSSNTFDNPPTGLEFLTERDLPSFVIPDPREFDYER